MKNYFFEGVQGPDLQTALAGLDNLLKTKYAETDFEILQVLINHEVIPGKITTGQPQVVCNAVVVLISPQPLPVEETKQPELPFILAGQA